MNEIHLKHVHSSNCEWCFSCHCIPAIHCEKYCKRPQWTSHI